MHHPTSPLPIPEDFDLKVFLFAKVTENGVFHESRRGASFAEQLVANGTPQDLALAEKVLEVVLKCQELNPKDAHYGNFYWMVEDSVVFDLNAVEFNLERLIPMMLRHGDRLKPDLRQRVLNAIRLGLAEIERLNVHVHYTNITLLDILNTCLGGELLQDERIARRGYDKLMEWMAFTDQNGAPTEFNSPTYTSVDIHALKILSDLVKDLPTRIRARLSAARLGLSVGLHIHQATGRWGGPHGRAYQPSVVCETPPEIQLVERWMDEGALPVWVKDALSLRPEQFQVDEGVYTPQQITTTTYQSPSFVLGTSSKETNGQTNVLIAQYARPQADRPGVIYTRYLTNDKWLGDFYHATDRTKSRNLLEEGRYWGVQRGSRSIGLYAIPKNLGVISSAKAVIIWTVRDQVEEIWVGDQKVDHLPCEVPPGEVVVIGSGGAWTAVRPLAHTDIGRGAPILLKEIQGDLVLEIYNYLGEAKPFWEMNSSGAFYQGVPLCGFYFEMAERTAYPDGGAFARVVTSGSMLDQSEAPFVSVGGRERLWRVCYHRDDQTLGIEVDLMEWKLKKRWTETGPLDWPMLASPLAVQSRIGSIEVGGARLTWGTPGKDLESAWLAAFPDSQRWVVGYHGRNIVPLRLELPVGQVKIEGISTGLIVWDHGKVSVDAVDLSSEPQVVGGQLVDQ